MTEKEIVHGSQLRITEKDVLSALPFGKRVSAFFFGGVFYMPDPTPQPSQSPIPMKPRAAVTYLPSLPKRLYLKYIHKRIRGFVHMLDVLYGKRTFNPYVPKGNRRG